MTELHVFSYPLTYLGQELAVVDLMFATGVLDAAKAPDGTSDTLHLVIENTRMVAGHRLMTSSTMLLRSIDMPPCLRN
jgi:hypothetical protein